MTQYFHFLQKQEFIDNMIQLQRPLFLTKFFIPTVAQSLGQKQGTFQIVEYHQKKQHYYSVHISDGHFRIKIIFLQKAGKQIRRGEIKLFSILQGRVKNNGQKLLLVREKLKVWEYHTFIGRPNDWKHGHSNVNGNGQTSINWPDLKDNQELIFLPKHTKKNRSSQEFVQKCQQMIYLESKIKDKKVKEQKFDKNRVSQSQKKAPAKPERRKLLIKSSQSQSSDSQQKLKRKSKQSIKVISESKEFFATPPPRNNKSETDSSGWSQLQLAIKLMTENKKNEPSIRSSKSEKKQIKSKSKSRSKSKKKSNSKINLQSESQSEDSYSELLSATNNLKRTSSFPPQFEIASNDLASYNNYDSRWVYAKVIEVKDLSDKFLCLLKTREQIILNMYLKKQSNNERLCMLIHHRIYQISLKNVKILDAVIKSYHSDIQLHSFVSAIKANLLYQKSSKPSDFCYMSIDKVLKLPQQIVVNVFGLVKSKSSFQRMKNEQRLCTNKILIVDFETSSSIQVTIFGSQDIEIQINEPLLIYNAKINVYQGKKSLINTKFTFFYFGFAQIQKIGEMTPKLQKTKEWLEKGNNIMDIIEDKENYETVKRIYQINKQNIQKLYKIQECQIVSFGENTEYESCDKCKKKTLNKYCKVCGKRQNPIPKRYIIATVGDSSGTLSIIWNDGECRRILQKYDYATFKQEWLMRPIEIWIKNDGKSDMFNVAGIKRLDLGEVSGRKLQRLKKLVEYI